ncbi:hypothetical protein SEA_KILLIGREW_38 [Mycobacterium phage Killigrew]|nr:hypothetical protein SEA_KILLIGREW_38 [Mycobacterium phage Killigrew]
MAKAENSITVKVIPVILTPEEVRKKVIDVLASRVYLSRNAVRIADEILEGITIAQVEDVEEKAQTRVWDSIHTVPLGVKVRDREDDVFWWDEDYELWWTSPPRRADPYRGVTGNDFNSTFGPFTEVIE